MSRDIFSTDFALSSRPAERRASQEDRRAKLIRALRDVAYFASHEQYDVPTRAERARVARIGATADQTLRQLMNPPKWKER